MKLELNGEIVHIATGGREHQKGAPFIVLLHGSGNSHLTWMSQTRSFAYDGFNIVAPDFPGHYLSSGKALASVEEQAKWLLELLDVMEAKEAVIIGHSQGALVALEIACQAPERVVGLALIGTAAAIPVNEQLIGLAEKDEVAACAAMVDWGHGARAHMHDNSWPGASMITSGQDVMSMNASGSLAIDLKACAAYEGGERAAKSLDCPVLCIFGAKDRMTPLKAGKALAGLIKNSEMVILENSGHMIPLERPGDVNDLVRGFLQPL